LDHGAIVFQTILSLVLATSPLFVGVFAMDLFPCRVVQRVLKVILLHVLRLLVISCRRWITLFPYFAIWEETLPPKACSPLFTHNWILLLVAVLRFVIAAAVNPVLALAT